MDRRAAGEGEVPAVDRQEVVRLGRSQVGRDRPRTVIPLAADSDLIGVGMVVRRRLPALRTDRVGHGHAFDLAAVGRQLDVAILRTTPQREFDIAVGRLRVVALIQEVGIELGIVVRAPLQGGIGRRTRAVVFGIVDARIVTEALAAVGRRIRRQVRVDRGADERAEEALGIDIVQLVERHVQQGAEFAGAGVPAIADQQVAVGRIMLRLIGIKLVEHARDFEALEVERTTAAHIDQAGDAAFDLVGRGRLVDFQRRDVAGGKVLRGDETAFGGKDIAAIIAGGDVGQAADQDAVGFAAVAGYRDAGDARQRVGNRGVGQLADFGGNDGVNDLVGILLEVTRRLQALAHAGDDDGAAGVVGVGRSGGGGLRRGGLGHGGATGQDRHGRGCGQYVSFEFHSLFPAFILNLAPHSGAPCSSYIIYMMNDAMDFFAFAPKSWLMVQLCYNLNIHLNSDS